MEQESLKQNQKQNQRYLVNGLMSVMGAGLTLLFLEVTSLHDAEAVLFGFSLSVTLSYWIPPRPKDGYFRWLARNLSFVTIVYFLIGKIPEWLHLYNK